MKKILFLGAMVLFMVSAFATDTPAYAPHGFHPGYRPVYGHGMHLRPVRSMHKHLHPGAAFFVRGTFFGPIPAAAEAASVQIALPGFAESDAAINEAAITEMTKISLPGFAESDAAINEAAVMEMTKISLPGFAEADAQMSSRWSSVVGR